MRHARLLRRELMRAAVAAALLGQNGFLFLILSVDPGRDPPSSSPYHLLVLGVLLGLSETDLERVLYYSHPSSGFYSGSMRVNV